ncbi:MAG: Asp23/Gls24 family envelope stress response protein [Chloroflexi bacterium]|nr:Asp23/Gls24 family envelope stress response protein [Chloroflexota bacterium]
MTEQAVGGSTNIADDVVANIAGVAAREVKGVSKLGASSIRRSIVERLGAGGAKTPGVEVEVGKKEAMVDLSITVLYGHNIPDVADRVRKNVAERLQSLCGLVAKEVNLNIVAIDFPEQAPHPRVA